MQIAFYGIARQIGTSANMAAISAGFMHYLSRPSFQEDFHRKENFRKEKLIFTDFGNTAPLGLDQTPYDLLVLNLSIPHQESAYVYFRHSFIRKNIIFLIGKYHENQLEERKKLVMQYRIDPMRVCSIPYNLRFQRAYENEKVVTYVENLGKPAGSYEDFVFEKYLKHTMRTIITYADSRKGEINYG